MIRKASPQYSAKPYVAHSTTIAVAPTGASLQYSAVIVQVKAPYRKGPQLSAGNPLMAVRRAAKGDGHYPHR